MKIYYVSYTRMPTEKARGAAIVKMCEAFADDGVNLNLIVPSKLTHIKENVFDYYEIRNNFSVTRLYSFNKFIYNRIGFYINFIQYSIRTFFYIKKQFTPGDIVYTRDSLVSLMFAIFNYPVVFETHSLEGVNFITKHAFTRTKIIVAITKNLKDDIVEKYGALAENILVAPSGIELSKYEDYESREEAQRRLGIESGEFVVMYIGSFQKWKGVDTLLKASLLLPEKIKVVMVGGDSEQVSLLEKEYPQVTFLGFRSETELADNQQAAQILVVPNSGKVEISTRHTSPLKVIAHMTSSLPILVSDLPSIRELLSEDSAYFFKADDSNSLAESIVQIYNEYPNALLKAKKAQEMTQRFDWKNRSKIIRNFIKNKRQINLTQNEKQQQ